MRTLPRAYLMKLLRVRTLPDEVDQRANPVRSLGETTNMLKFENGPERISILVICTED